ncbi:hypothetical protein ACFW9L_16320 [Streptomyces sp. NPDC059517]|uniref:hypothetical protein n=1 Tax=Streptomyces sp. NPDC059517 TaxID=3346855 RepID=UPI003676FD81
METEDSFLLSRRITKKHPPRFGWQLLRLESVASFTCSRCHQAKTARSVAVPVHSSKMLCCNGCYGRGLAENTSAPVPPFGTSEPRNAWVDDEAETDVVIRQFDPGDPHAVVEDGPVVEWKFVLRNRHLAARHCPVPSQVAGQLTQAIFSAVSRYTTWSPKLTIICGGRYRKLLLEMPLHARLTQDQRHLKRVNWQQAGIMTGTRITGRWRPGQNLKLLITALEEPVVLTGRRMLYAYDPRVVAHELTKSRNRKQDVNLSELARLVRDTVRELGYLDERGRALLPMRNLINNIRASSRDGSSWASNAVQSSVNELIANGHLTWETGSHEANGILNFPARPGQIQIRLVCYTPDLRPAPVETQHKVVTLPSTTSQHQVAGHLMEIGHLGKTASDEAKAAYTEEHRRAGLAGSHSVPKGYTFVKKHQRGNHR